MLLLIHPLSILIHRLQRNDLKTKCLPRIHLKTGAKPRGLDTKNRSELNICAPFGHVPVTQLVPMILTRKPGGNNFEKLEKFSIITNVSSVNIKLFRNVANFATYKDDHFVNI